VASRDNHIVNALRATAAILVVVSHVRNLFFQDYSQVHHDPVTAGLYAVASFGHGAVMVFFALSGYWVGGSVLRAFGRHAFSWRDYALRRGVRLWIVLLPALALTGLVDHVGLRALANTSVYQGNGGYFDLPTNLPHHLSAVTLAGNAVFLQAIRTTTFGTNGALWSLAYEFWFYLLFPLALLVATRRAWWLRVVSAGLLVAIGALVGRTVLEYFLAWLTGVVVVLNEDRLRGLIAKTPTTVVGFGRVVAAGLLFGGLLADKAHEAYSTDLLVAILAAVLLATLVTDVQWGGLRGRVLRWISGYAHSSYSLYAIHLPLAALLSAVILPHISDRWSPSVPSLLGGVGIVALLMVAGWLFAQVTEGRTDPVRAWLSSRLPMAPRRAPVPA
jgi:peptidoglycan/LPS O-acetylase OafA/YrhL